jgi:hypothetical protein
LDRPRHKGIAKFDDHFPSGDQSAELLAIEVELGMASSCHKVVYGQSGFVGTLIADMTLDGKNFTTHYVKTQISREAARKFNYSGFFTNIANGTARLPHP